MILSSLSGSGGRRLSTLAVILLTTACSSGGHTTGDGRTVTFVIVPTDPVLLVQNGSDEPIDFSVLAHEEGHDGETVEATWSINGASLGAIDSATGRFTSNGFLGGMATVTATVDGGTATTTLTVQIENTEFGEGVPADAPDRFDPNPTTGDPESPTLLYPLDEAVIPRSLKSPNVQWEGGVEGDLYRIQATAGLTKATAYIAHSGEGFDYAWPIEDLSWQIVAAAGVSARLSITVDRWVGASSETFRSDTHELTVAAATLNGAIYYWDLTDGKILRITKDGREDFMPSPPKVGEKRCVACHAMSRDGKQMAANIGDGIWQQGRVFDLEEDLSQDPAPTADPPGNYQKVFASFNPDSTRLIVNRTDYGTEQSKLLLVDATNGNLLPTTGVPLPQDGTSHPTWSPDGAQIAYIANIVHGEEDPGIATDFITGDLAVIPVTGPDAFGPTEILRAADGKANSWPTFSPDSEWIAYARGIHSRGRDDIKGKVYPGSLHIMPRDGGDEIVLAKANGTGENTHLPNFSPFTEGGYFWLTFYTTRDYGNEQVGTKGKNLRQLWITAISTDPQSGQDPSHVPYWLPDQDVTTHNMSGYWTLPPPVPVQ